MNTQPHLQAQPTMPRRDTISGAREWYIQVDKKNYGPYTDQVLWQFICEGRVNANSLVSQYPNTAYRSVSTDSGLMNWIAQIPNAAPQEKQQQTRQHTEVHMQPAGRLQGNQNHNPENHNPHNPHNHNPQGHTAQSVFIVMAEIRSGRGMDFLQSLQGLGDVERIGDTMWILKARASSEDIRNILCQPLGADDRLFVLDSYANKTAWFNLGAQMDVRMRDLWDINT